MSVDFSSACEYLLPSGICDAKSEQYQTWPHCRTCHNLTCPTHAEPGSLREHEYDRQGDGDSGPTAEMSETVLCLECAE